MKSASERKKSSKRRLKLINLLYKIYNKDVNSEKKPLADLYFEKYPPRENYISPLDRDTYNYGYLDSFEYTPSLW